MEQITTHWEVAKGLNPRLPLEKRNILGEQDDRAAAVDIAVGAGAENPNAVPFA